jgi:hypothetical protein
MKHAFRTGLAKVPNRKITEEIATEIKRMQKHMGDTEIARKLNISRAICNNIRYRDSWVHIEV